MTSPPTGATDIRSFRLVLASASPRRQDLLRQAGFVFEVDPANIDESDHEPLLPSALAEHLAVRKANVVATRRPNDIVLAADTVVAFGDQVLGKPENLADARRMLQLLEGTTHVVVTGVAVAHAAADWRQSRRVFSAVHMRSLTAGEIEQYLSGGEWQGKAGGYGIQDPDPFVTRTAGCVTNVVGLPMRDACELLAAVGITPHQ